MSSLSHDLVFEAPRNKGYERGRFQQFFLWHPHVGSCMYGVNNVERQRRLLCHYFHIFKLFVDFFWVNSCLGLRHRVRIEVSLHNSFIISCLRVAAGDPERTQHRQTPGSGISSDLICFEHLIEKKNLQQTTQIASNVFYTFTYQKKNHNNKLVMFEVLFTHLLHPCNLWKSVKTSQCQCLRRPNGTGLFHTLGIVSSFSPLAQRNM